MLRRKETAEELEMETDAVGGQLIMPVCVAGCPCCI